MWKGATDALNARPVRISASPTTSSGSCALPDAAISWKPSRPVAPYTSADPCERGPAVAGHRVCDQRGRARAAVVEDAAEDTGGDEARGSDGCREGVPEPPGHEHRSEQCHAGDADQRQRRREREPVDVRRRDRRADHGVVPPSDGSDPWVPPNEWPLTAFGQTESATRQTTSGMTMKSWSERRSGARSGTVSPRRSCRTAEMTRSVYIAARTIAAAPTAA